MLEASAALDNYKRACDAGRGAIFLTVVRSKVTEAIDFSRQYGRALLLFGLPVPNLSDRALTGRLRWITEVHGIDDADILVSDASPSKPACAHSSPF